MDIVVTPSLVEISASIARPRKGPRSVAAALPPPLGAMSAAATTAVVPAASSLDSAVAAAAASSPQPELRVRVEFR